MSQAARRDDPEYQHRNQQREQPALASGAGDSCLGVSARCSGRLARRTPAVMALGVGRDWGESSCARSRSTVAARTAVGSEPGAPARIRGASPGDFAHFRRRSRSRSDAPGSGTARSLPSEGKLLLHRRKRSRSARAREGDRASRSQRREPQLPSSPRICVFRNFQIEARSGCRAVYGCLDHGPPAGFLSRTGRIPQPVPRFRAGASRIALRVLDATRLRRGERRSATHSAAADPRACRW